MNMLKKIILLLVVALLINFTGCNNKGSELTIDDFVTAFSNNGISADDGNKPFYALIGASDGVTFNHDDKVVIYTYNSEKDLKKARDEYEIIKDWPSNGRFLLETSNQDVMDIFSGVK